MSATTQKDREIQRRLRILKHAEETGHVGRTCRYFGSGRASFYRWKAALDAHVVQFREAQFGKVAPPMSTVPSSCWKEAESLRY